MVSIETFRLKRDHSGSSAIVYEHDSTEANDKIITDREMIVEIFSA